MFERWCEIDSLDTLVSTLPSLIYLGPSLKALTALSAGPFEAWWYEAVRICRILFIFRKSSNSFPTKLLPLSVATISGSPWVAKAILNLPIVALEVELVMWNASIHFECEPTRMRNIFLRNGPTLHLDYGVPKVYAATPKGVMVLPVHLTYLTLTNFPLQIRIHPIPSYVTSS